MTASANAGDTGKTEVPTVPGRLPLLGHTAAVLRQRLAFTARSRTHGPVVRVYLGKLPLHFVTTAELAHQVLTGDTDKFDKGIFVDKLRRAFGNALVGTDGEFHRRQRRMIQPAFHRRPLFGDDDRTGRRTGEFLAGWTSAGTGPGHAGPRDHRGRPHAVLHRLRPVGERRFDRAVAHVDRVVDDVVDSARGDRDDLLSALLDARDESTGAAMDRQQVRDEVVTLLTAGTETTGIALSWLFHELAANAEVKRRVHAEVDDVLGRRAATVDDRPRLPYLHRVITEVLRRYPLWLMLRRANTSVSLGGVRVPAGTEVGFSPHALHHDPRYYDDPARFDPDRWLPERAAAVPKSAYVPFAGGLHHCPGHAFAHLEIAIVAATLASRWRLVQVPGEPVRPKVIGLLYPNRLPMTVRHRRSAP